MKAIVLSRYGEPDVLRLQEVAKPEPRRGQVLIKVRASAVNDWDWCFTRGEPYVYRLMFGLTRPKVRILGAEVAGTVEAVGEAVQSLQPGDDVYGDLSEAGFGGFAEYVCVREDALAKKPRNISFERAAALPHAAALALQGLVDIGQIQQGERVLINGAGGGVGMIGVQIAKRYGAEVSGIDSAAKLDALAAIGFDHVFDYQKHDFTSEGRCYDLILDTKTTRSPFRHLRSLTPRGRYVTVGGEVSRLLQTASAGPLIGAFSRKQVRIVALKPNKELLRIRHQGMQVLDEGIEVEALELFGVVEALAHRIGQAGMLMEDSQVELVGPPVAIGVAAAAARHRAFAVVWHGVLSGDVPRDCVPHPPGPHLII